MSSPSERYAAARRRTERPALHVVPRRVPVPARRLPAARVRGARGRLRRARLRPDRRGQDRGRRVRRAPGPRVRAEVLLHDADQGAVEPEVQRPGRAARQRTGRPADRRQLGQRRRADRRDDDRGAAQHALRRQRLAHRPRLRRDGRGALPRRPVPRRRLGRGDHPPAGRGAPGQPVRDGVERRGVRRVAGVGARRDEGDRARAAPGAAVAAHADRPPAVRPVRRRRHGRRPDADPLRAGTDALPRSRRVQPARRPARAAQLAPARHARTSSPGSTATGCCRPSPSCSAAPAATPRCSSACTPGCGSPPTTSATRSTPSSTSAPPRCRARTSRCCSTGTGATGCAAASPRTTPGWSRCSRRRSRSCSCAAWSRRCSRPRRSRSASTCRPARSCSSGCRSSTARPMPT